MDEDNHPQPMAEDVDNNPDNDSNQGGDSDNREEEEEVAEVSTTRDVLPYENWAAAVGRRVEDPLPENVLHVMNQVFHNDMLVENILEKVIFSKDRAAIRSCRLVSKPWVCAVSKLYKKMKKPLFLVNTSRDLFPHNDPPRPIFDHHSVLCEFLRPITRPGRMEGFIPTFALHLSPHYFRKCNYTDFVNCLVQCGPSLVELFISFPKNSLMSFLLPPRITFPNLITMGVCFTGVTLHNSLYAGPFPHQHEYFPNHSSIHLVQSILNAASNLRNFTLMRCQTPINPPDLENLYLPEKLVSLKVETPLRGFDLLLRRQFENLAELTLNASLALYSEGDIYELLSKLSSNLRVLSLAGNTSPSARHTSPVKLPRMESLTKFAMFKPWEFEIRNPPINFEEILPKLETLVFATQTETSFGYLMSGMRSTTVTSFSAWLTSVSYRAQVVGGPIPHPGGFVNWMDPNPFRPNQANPFMMAYQRMDMDLMPAREPAERERIRRAVRAREYRQRNIDRERRFYQNVNVIPNNAEDVPIEIILQPPARVVGGGAAGPRDPLDLDIPAVLADERQDEQHLLRMRRARLRMAHVHDVQRRLIIEQHQQQQQQRRRDQMARERDLEPRVMELRRRLQEIRGRLDIQDRQRARDRWRGDNANPEVEAPAAPEILIEVVPNNEQEQEGAQMERRRPAEESSTDSEDELDEMLDNIIPALPPVPNLVGDAEEGRMQPLQVLAAAAVAEDNMERIQERVRALENNINDAEARNDPPPLDYPQPPNPEGQMEPEIIRNNGNVDVVRRPRLLPPRNEVDRLGRNDEGAGGRNNNVRGENNQNGVGVRGLGEVLRAARARIGGGAIGDNEIGAQLQRDEDLRIDVGGRLDVQNARVRVLRRFHHQLLEHYRRHRPARQQQHHLLPDRPVTMTKDKMQQINVAFINLTKLKINICGPDVCGLKYIFEDMKSLQVLKIVVEKSLWPIKWDSVLTGIPTEFCEAVKSSSELWDEVYLHENQVSIRSLTKLEELGILECLKVNEQAGQDVPGEEHLISDVAFHFSLLKMKNLRHLEVTPGFSPSPTMVQKWYEEKGYPIKMKAIGRMETEFEEY